MDRQDDEDGVHAAFSIEGRIDVRLDDGSVVALTRTEARFRGGFGAPEAPFRLTFEGRLGELRKIGAVNASVQALLPALAAHPDAASGTLTLLASPAKVAALREAAAGIEEAQAQALLDNERWLLRLFDLEGFDAESVGTIERWT